MVTRWVLRETAYDYDYMQDNNRPSRVLVGGVNHTCLIAVFIDYDK